MTEHFLPMDSDEARGGNRAPSAWVGILLAAGAGSRYLAAADGGASARHHKLLATLQDGRPVALASAQSLLSVVPETIAIVTDDPRALAAQLSDAGCEILQIPASPHGMGISLAAAARYLINRQTTPVSQNGRHAGSGVDACTEAGPDIAAAPAATLSGCIVALADMPWIRPGTLTQLLAHAAPDRIVVPVYNGQRGHPVVFGADFLRELAGLTGDTGARAILARHGVVEIECDDAGVVRDVDTPADLVFNEKSVK